MAFLRRVAAIQRAILGSFRASVMTMAPTMILRRVSLAFPALTEPETVTPPMLESETPSVSPLETPGLHERIARLEAALTDAKAERDEWRDQAKRLAMALPAPPSEPAARPGQGLWARLFGKGA